MGLISSPAPLSLIRGGLGTGDDRAADAWMPHSVPSELVAVTEQV